MEVHRVMKANRLEPVVKGFANRRRIRMLILLQRHPGLGAVEIGQLLRMGFKATHQHLAKSVAAGLLLKRRAGGRVVFRLSPRGGRVLAFLGTL